MKVNKIKGNERIKNFKCPKKQGKATPEFFKITEPEKAELGLLAVELKNITRGFNLHTFLLRRKKMKGYFPPADKVIKVCRYILGHKKEFKGSNLWAYLTIAINQEERLSFAELNIKENEDFKKMQPIGILLNPELIKKKND